GPKVTGTGGIGVGLGTGKNWGSGGDGVGFGGRGSGHRKAMLAQYGGTKRTERAVTGALIWLANHQMADGSWSLTNYTSRCKDATCTGPGSAHADSGATAMGVLPFLAAGQTHKTRGPYRGNIAAGINWLIRNQQKDGNLAKGSNPTMYSHGLATIALCEAAGLSGDPNIRMAAQGAVNFIINAQNQGTGGWRYNPGDPGDTSVVGWQIMALKSASMAGLSVSGSTFEGGSKWLDSVQKGPNNSLYSYTPGQGHSNTMTSVGLLCRQYLGAKRDSPMMTDGVKYLLGNLPDVQLPNVYYWYYASQVLHNMSGYEWDQWNRKMRKILVDTQCKESSSCANGSWNPAGDLWGKNGGRVMMTSLAALTLEIYYRYLPLFKDAAEAGGAAAVVAQPAAAKAKKAETDEE
ncbi:MAG: prenyltransferase/squalene oxidase repeat-containing protein, partial [Thermoguttaceae bacterium]